MNIYCSIVHNTNRIVQNILCHSRTPIQFLLSGCAIILLYSNCSIVHNTNPIVQKMHCHSRIIIVHPQASCTYKYPPPSSHFQSSSRINSNNSNNSNNSHTNSFKQPKLKTKSNSTPHQTSARPRKSKTTQIALQQDHARQNRHVFRQQHPRCFGHRSFRRHSSGTHDHGHAPTIRQSRQQPPHCRWFKLSVQGYEQHWWHRHRYGYWRAAEALLLG